MPMIYVTDRLFIQLSEWAKEEKITGRYGESSPSAAAQAILNEKFGNKEDIKCR